ncbi:MAG: hypothetical protein ACHQAX_01235 [Gammaproteobacteria bacterium]
MVSAEDLKINAISHEYKQLILKYPELWIDLLAIFSEKAYAYLNSFSDAESLTLIKDSQTNATLMSTTLFTHWIDYIVEFSDPLNSNTTITPAHMQRMVARCLKDAAWDQDRVETYYVNHYISFYYEDTRRYIMQAHPDNGNLTLGHTNIHGGIKYISEPICTSDTQADFIAAYNTEYGRAQAMASKCIAILDKSIEGFLDPEFRRYNNGHTRHVMTKLAMLKQYDLLMAIFKKLSPAVARDELTREGTDSIFAILVNALPKTRVILSKLITHAQSGTSKKEFNNKIRPETLNIIELHSESLYQKLTDTSQPNALSSKTIFTQKNDNEFELDVINVYDNDIAFWDGMDFEEVLGVPYVIPEVIERDLITKPVKLCWIAKAKKILASQYITALSDAQTKILASNASEDVLIDLCNHTAKEGGIQKNNDMLKLLTCANNSVLETVFGSLSRDQWSSILDGSHSELIKVLLGTVTNDNASRLLEKLDFNLLNILAEKHFIIDAMNLYLKASSFYVVKYGYSNERSSVNTLIHHVLMTGQKNGELTDTQKNVVRIIITPLLAGDDSIFILFVNKEASSLGLIFSAFTDDELNTHQLRERSLKALNLNTWLALPKKATSYPHFAALQLLNCITTKNAAALLNVLKFDLLNALTDQDLYKEAQELCVKLPSQDMPPKLIKWVKDKLQLQSDSYKTPLPDLNTDVKPIQQSTSEIDMLRAENAALKEKNAALEKMLLMSRPAFTGGQNEQDKKLDSNSPTAASSNRSRSQDLTMKNSSPTL